MGTRIDGSGSVWAASRCPSHVQVEMLSSYYMYEPRVQERSGLGNPYLKDVSIKMVFKALTLDKMTQGERANREEKRAQDTTLSHSDILRFGRKQKQTNKQAKSVATEPRQEENCKCVKEAQRRNLFKTTGVISCVLHSCECQKCDYREVDLDKIQLSGYFD